LRVQDTPTRPIDWKVALADTVQSVVDKLKSENSRWFVPIVAANGTLVNVIHKEGVWRFLVENPAEANAALAKPMSDLLAFLERDATLKKQFTDIYVAAKADMTVAAVHEAVLKKNDFLAVVTDGEGKPVASFDTANIRMLLLGT